MRASLRNPPTGQFERPDARPEKPFPSNTFDGIVEHMFESNDSPPSAVAEMVDVLGQLNRDIDDRARINLLHELEVLKSACAAAQAKVAADLDSSRRQSRAEQGVPREQRGRGIAAEVALARRESPHRGNQHLGLASALVHEMPYALSLLEQGLLNEWRATLLVRETACLTREDRTAVDRILCEDPATLAGLGDKSIVAKARALAAQFDAEAMVRRARKAVADRRVTTRPAPDTMAYLTALLPVAQAVTVQATLGRDANTIVAQGDTRTRSQIMADLLVERVTGLSTATAAPVTVNVVISDETLFGGGSAPAHVDGYGPIPAGIARDWIKQATGDDSEAVTLLRRVYANPKTGALTALESHARCFPAGLGRFIDTRDRICRTPWCDAPIRHHDHLREHRSGGPTTSDNGAGLCEACNYAKQGEGWQTEPEESADGALHSYRLETPTRHRYRSTAPPLPTPLVQLDIFIPAEEILIDILRAA